MTDASERHGLVGPLRFWEMKRAFQIAFLKSAGLRPAHHLLDLGCGTLRGGIPLIAYLDEGRYTGVEAREAVLDEGRKELAGAGLEDRRPTLIHEADPRRLAFETPFDVIWAFSVLIHMSDDILVDTLAMARRALAPDGSFYANVNIGTVERPAAWQGFPVMWHPLAFYEDACRAQGLRTEVVGLLRDLGHVTDVDAMDEQRMLRIRLSP